MLKKGGARNNIAFRYGTERMPDNVNYDGGMCNDARVAVLWLVCAGLAGAAEPFSFVQMSDPQFGMYTENKSFEHEMANFDFAIAAANRLHPKFVVVTGDLINQAGNAAQAAEYRRIAAKLDAGIRLYNVAGNHDV